MDSRWARVARGTGAGTFATMVAAASHGLAGPIAPSMVGITLALGFSVLLSIGLSGRSVSAVRLAVAISASQFAFHSVFSTFSDTATVVSGGGHHAVQYVLGGVVADSHSGPLMGVAHAIAAVLTFAIVLFGERAFFGIAATARLAIRAFVARWSHPTPAPRLPAFLLRPDTRIAARAVREFLEVLDSRGPPRAAHITTASV